MAGNGNSLYLLILTTITGCWSDNSGLRSYVPCTEIGGFCKDTFEDGGCKGGKFHSNLCPGPFSYQCCVRPPWNPPTLPPWRMCYDCSYSLSDGISRGQENCFNFDNGTIESPINEINCTSNCTKEWLKLDEDNYQVIRRCANDCQPLSVFSHHTVHCCHGDFCNSSLSDHMTCLPLFIRLVALLILTFLFTTRRK